MKIFLRKPAIMVWVIQKVNIADVARWALNSIPWEVILHWSLRLIVVVLRSDWVPYFEKPVPKLASFIASKLADGTLSKNDAADIIEEFDKQL